MKLLAAAVVSALALSMAVSAVGPAVAGAQEGRPGPADGAAHPEPRAVVAASDRTATQPKLPRHVVLYIKTGPSIFTPPGAEVTVFRDGRVVFNLPVDDPSSSDPSVDEREVIERTIPPAALEELLDRAARAGALRDFDFGWPDITDQATTTIEVRRGDTHRKHSIYALLFSGAGYSSGEHPLSEEQIEARARLGRFVLAASDPDTYGKWERIEHPTGATDVGFRTATEQNGWGAEYPNAVGFTVYGDGRVVYDDGTERQWSERRLQRFLRAAGLLEDTEYGDAMVTDQGTTTVEIHAAGVDQTFEIYALELPEGDRGLPKEQRQARRDLRRFLHSPH